MAQLRTNSTVGGKQIATMDEIRNNIEPIDKKIENILNSMQEIDGGSFDDEEF